VRELRETREAALTVINQREEEIRRSQDEIDLKIKIQKIDELLRNPKWLTGELMQSEGKERNDLFQEVARYGTENGKDRLIASLVTNPELVESLKDGLRAFRYYEIELLKTFKSENEADVLDRILSILPRIVLCSVAIKSLQDEQVKNLFRLSTVPAWIFGWFMYREAGKEIYSQAIEDLNGACQTIAVDIAAYGRLEGHTVNLGPAMLISGQRLRRGLKEEDRRLLGEGVNLSV